MDKASPPIEFNNEIDEIIQSNNEYYTLSVERLNKLAEGFTDISGGVVNLKQLVHGPRVQALYEVTITVNMGSDHITTTEQGEEFHSTLVDVLDAVERQVHEHRAHQ